MKGRERVRTMKKEFNKGKSIVAILLAVAMFIVGMPTGSQVVFAENTNYALGGTVTSSNTNESLATGYPAAQITDGIPYYTRPAGQTAVINYQENGLAYYEIALQAAAKLNQVRVYFNQAEADRRPKDIAVDVKKTDGTWVRAAEMQNINYDTDLIVTDNPRYLAFNFEAVEDVAVIRVTANKTRNNSSNFRLMEVEAYFDETITTYTNYAIPEVVTTTPETGGDSNQDQTPDTTISDNYALNATVATSNTNESLATGYPASQVTDGNPIYTRPADQTSVINYKEDGLGYYELTLAETAELNQVRVYFNVAEASNRPKDIAVDLKKEDGTWIRVAEMHNIDYDNDLIVTDNPRYLAFNFEAVEDVTTIRVTGNKTRNASTNFRLMEIEAYKDPAITTYTGTTKDANASYNIPELGATTPDAGGDSNPEQTPDTTISDNYALNATVATSNTNESLATGYPASQVTDGNPIYTRPADQTSVINYQENGLGYYELTLNQAAKLNQVRVYFNQAEPEKRPKDIAVDLKKEDGTWIRVAEMHNIDYDNDLIVTDNPRYLAFNFEAVEGVKAIRVTGNATRNTSTNFRLMEIEAYMDTAITTYTGTTADSNSNYNIPEVGATTEPDTGDDNTGAGENTISDNYALNGKVTSSNTNDSLATGYPAAQATDGVPYYTRPADQTAVINYQENGLAYYQVALIKKAKINQVRVYVNQAEPEKRPKDIAVDIKKADGTWVRVAEMHNINYDKALVVTDNPRYLAFNFEKIEAKAIRVTANQARNSSTNFRIMEIEAYLDSSITEYTGTKQDSNVSYNIPEVGKETSTGTNAGGTSGGKNYALNGKVTSSNTNASLEAGYPAAQATDGVTPYTRPADQTAVINYQANGLAYYEVELSQKAKINQVRVYFNMAEPEKRPKDIAVDIKKADGTWVRAAEMHNIDYDKALVVTDNPRYLAFNFEALDATTIRVTANQTRNSSDSTNFRIMEIEAYYDSSIKTYTGVKQDANEAYNIPLVSSNATKQDEAGTTVKEEQDGNVQTGLESDKNVSSAEKDTKTDYKPVIRTAGAIIGTTLLVSILGFAAYFIWSKKQKEKTVEGNNE